MIDKEEDSEELIENPFDDNEKFVLFKAEFNFKREAL